MATLKTLTLPAGLEVTEIGLQVTDVSKLNFRNITTAWEEINHWRNGLRWACGDLLCLAEDRYGEAMAQLVDDTKYSVETLRHLARVSRCVPYSIRRPGLSFSHHEAVASLRGQTELQETLLDEAEQRQYGRDAFREIVKQFMPTEKLEQESAKSIAQEIREQLGLDEPGEADHESGGPIMDYLQQMENNPAKLEVTRVRLDYSRLLELAQDELIDFTAGNNVIELTSNGKSAMVIISSSLFERLLRVDEPVEVFEGVIEE